MWEEHAANVLRGFLTMDAMMWAATTAILWHIYGRGWKGTEVRTMVLVLATTGAFAIGSTGLALVWFLYDWRGLNVMTILALSLSGIFTATAVAIYMRLASRIPSE